jgi:hypothetical protein
MRPCTGVEDVVEAGTTGLLDGAAEVHSTVVILMVEMQGMIEKEVVDTVMDLMDLQPHHTTMAQEDAEDTARDTARVIVQDMGKAKAGSMEATYRTVGTRVTQALHIRPEGAVEHDEDGELVRH